MSCPIQANLTTLQSLDCSPEFTKVPTFKNLANAVLITQPRSQNLRTTKWSAADYISVLAYSWIRGVSIHEACEKLNQWHREHCGFHPQTFLDRRQSRAVPHQTSVNAWLRRLSLTETQRLMQSTCEAALKRTFCTPNFKHSVVLEFDLTYLGYWGKRRDPRIKGTTLVKGTRFMRHYHGAMLYSGGLSMFVSCQHVAKHQSKIPFMIATTKWIQSLGIKIRHCVIDREYYRFDILHEFKKLGVNVLTPAKGSKKLTHAKEDYFLGKKGRLQRFRVQNKARKGKITKYTRCWICFFPRGGHRLRDLKLAYRRKRLSLKEVCAQIYALVTTHAPQYRSNGFFHHLRKYYKQRWQIETAFRDLRHHHAIYRCDRDGARLFLEMGRFLLLNSWYEQRFTIGWKALYSFATHRNQLVEAQTGCCML